MNLDGRFSGQLYEIRDVITNSGAEGVDLEYWSPTPYWKSNNSYIGGSLKQFDATFLGQFGDAVAEEIRYLNSWNTPVRKFGLQNEPIYAVAYSSCVYSDSQYVAAYNAVCAKVRAAHPTVHLHANSLDGQNRATLRNGLNPSLVDGWT